ncbi:MAG: hypothetical protein ACRDQX_12145 [Pseudonocardiaceae bacterium]
MARDREYPGAEGIPDWGSLYRARGDEVARHCPVFTGEVFEKVPDRACAGPCAADRSAQPDKYQDVDPTGLVRLARRATRRQDFSVASASDRSSVSVALVTKGR